jgi:hypothetical protein
MTTGDGTTPWRLPHVQLLGGSDIMPLTGQSGQPIPAQAVEFSG